jgi:flagellar basal body-associated protein FliL
MQIDKRTIIKKISMFILLLIVILLLILGIQTSKFSDIKKYESDKSPRDNMSQTRSSSSNTKDYSMQVTIENDTIANLGDFTFNIAGNKKLVANISLKYKSNTKDNSWFESNSNNDVKKEILQKSVILRDAAISTMLGSSRVTADSSRMRKALKETLNNNLSTGKVEEVYFNKFIIQ